MRSINVFAAIVLAVALSPICSAGRAQSVKLDDYKAAVAAARAALEKAAEVDGEWRDVDKLLQKAELAAEKGDLGTAIKLANTAQFQSDTGYKQAVSQKDAGPRF